MTEDRPFAFPKETCPTCRGRVTLAPAGFYILHRNPKTNRTCPVSGTYRERIHAEVTHAR
jgi:hypothetical protein